MCLVALLLSPSVGRASSPDAILPSHALVVAGVTPAVVVGTPLNGTAVSGQLDAGGPAAGPASSFPSRRPGALVPLYVSFGALQGLDAFLTVRALDRGAVEMNPVLAPISGNRALLAGVKGLGTAVVIYGTERLWRRNRVAAVVLMAAVNGAYAAVVAHNYLAGR